LLLRWTGPSGLKTSSVESKYKYKVAHWLQEIARALTTFKLAGQPRLALRKTNDLVDGYLHARSLHFRVLVRQYGYMVAFKTIVTAVLLALGGILVIDNQITLGQFVAAEIVVLLILSSVEKVILTLADVYDLLTGLEKLGYFTDIPLDPDSGMPFEKTDTGKGMQLDVRNLSFQFNDNAKPTLNGIDFSIPAGQKVCVAGYNGSGKSTLIQILSGLLLNFEGSVSYNGVPTLNFNLNSLRSFIGDHGAEEDIFQGTLMENLCLGHEDVDFHHVSWAIREVGLVAFVQQLPHGYDSLLVPNGRNLPQSVRTKILIARSILSHPRLLAMEEFMSQLQPTEREKICDMLAARDHPWTLVAVSNDPILASRCERILIMKDGRVIADDTFEALKNTPHFEHIFQLNTANNTAVKPYWPNTNNE